MSMPINLEKPCSTIQICAYKSSWSVRTKLDPTQLKGPHTCVAKDDILRLVVVEKFPLLEPLSLCSTLHRLFLAERRIFGETIKLHWAGLVHVEDPARTEDPSRDLTG